MLELIYDRGLNISQPKESIFIYCWENLVNGKKYIGQTKRGKKRLSDEKSINNIGCIFKNALVKYGQINFRCYILEYCKTEELDEKEKYWIEKEKSHFSEWGYNLTYGGQNENKTIFYSSKTNQYYKDALDIPEEEFSFISKCSIMENCELEPVRVFYAFDKQNHILKSFISLDAASIFSNKEPIPSVMDNIRKCLNGALKSAYGIIWSYNKDYSIPYINNNHRSIAQYSLDGQLVNIFSTIREAAAAVGTRDKNIWGCLNRKNTYKCSGYMWRYVEGDLQLEIKPYLDQIPFKIIQYNLKKEKIKEYASIADAAAESGDSRERISAVCNGHISNTRRYIWEKYWNTEERGDDLSKSLS